MALKPQETASSLQTLARRPAARAFSNGAGSAVATLDASVHTFRITGGLSPTARSLRFAASIGEGLAGSNEASQWKNHLTHPFKMKASRALFASLLASCLFSITCLAAGPTRDEVKLWTKLNEAGEAAAKKQDLPEAFKQFFGALKIAERFEEKDIRLAENLSMCGHLLMIVKNPAVAEPYLRRAATAREAARGAAHRETAWAWMEHAAALTDLDKFSEAEALIERARRNLEKAFGPYHTTLGSCFAAQARIKARQKQFAEAEELYKNALRFLSRSSTSIRSSLDGLVFSEGKMSSVTVARTQIELAELYVSAERLPDAVTAYREAVKQVESQQGKEGLAIPGVLVSLAKVQMKQQDYAAAETTIERAVKLAEKKLGTDHRVTIVTGFARVNLLIAQEKWKEAEAQGLLTTGNATGVLHPMSREWIPMLEAMMLVDEKMGNPDSAKARRERIAATKEFHRKLFDVPPQ